MPTNYELYNTNDFLADNLFISWIKYKKPETDVFWNNWIRNNPSNLQAFKDAEKQLNFIFSLKRIEPEEGLEKSIWQRILQSISQPGIQKQAPIRKLKMWMIRTAVAAGILATAAVWYYMQPVRTKAVSTSFGQLKKITLPDETEINLNANSSIQFPGSWKKDKPREVFLTGEAFFVVKHLNTNKDSVAVNEKFIVHTDKINVEVLGTSFNIKERRGKSEVSLEKGSLRVQVKSDSLKQLLLVPGELAEYNHITKELKKIKDNPALHKDWTEKKMLNNNTTVADILEKLEDMYGYKVVLKDSSVAARRIDGVIPLRNENNVMFILSNMLNVDIKKINNQLIIEPRKQ